jgi:hypothetical protein
MPSAFVRQTDDKSAGNKLISGAAAAVIFINFRLFMGIFPFYY